ncbi:hypothetical protein Lal_00036641 [Lupinus albus]|nr:hypothetical protein Lal_00036641 [Lupinus albus]
MRLIFLQCLDICYPTTEHMSTCLLGALRTELPQWCNTQSIYCMRHVAKKSSEWELMRPHFERMLGNLRQKSKGNSLVRQHPKIKKWTQSHDEGRSNYMIRSCYTYYEKLTKVINENNRKATCQLFRSFSRES